MQLFRLQEAATAAKYIRESNVGTVLHKARMCFVYHMATFPAQHDWIWNLRGTGTWCSRYCVQYLGI